MSTMVLMLERGKLRIRGTGHSGAATVVVGQTAKNGDARQSTYKAKAWTEGDAERFPEIKRAVGDIVWDEAPVFGKGSISVEITDSKGHVTSEVFHRG